MKSELDALRVRIESELDARLSARSNLAPDLTEAMRYATLSGGKRLRPLFLTAACTAVGGSPTIALAPACAVEFIHAYSLVHDDLPAMDDDELRHGVPSTHIRFGEAMAILAGDALQALAFRTLAEAPGLTSDTRLRALTLLADAAGWNGMVGGQALDLEAEHRHLELSELAQLHGAKTGALIRAAVQIGALVGNPAIEDRTFAALGEFAGRVGLAFQVVDDVLDITATTDVLGKPAGSDLKSGKSTYPGLLGLDAARAYAESLLESALSLHASLQLGHSQLADLAERSVRRAF